MKKKINSKSDILRSNKVQTGKGYGASRGFVFLPMLMMMLLAVLMIIIGLGVQRGGNDLKSGKLRGTRSGESEAFTPTKEKISSSKINLPKGSNNARLAESNATLECINLPGVNLPRTSALDHRVARRLKAVMEDLSNQGIKISFTWGFRSTCQQRNVNSGGNLKARPGTSPHEAGRAVDVNGILQRPDSSQIITTFQKYGWVWLGPKDPPHFEIKGFTVNEASPLQWIEKIQQDFQTGQPMGGCRGAECGS
jgi:hypothetical protein